MQELVLEADTQMNFESQTLMALDKELRPNGGSRQGLDHRAAQPKHHFLFKTLEPAGGEGLLSLIGRRPL